MKKICFVLSLLMLFSVLSVCVAAWGEYCGDTSGDGFLDAKDYMMLKRYVLGTLELDWHAQYRADVNLDGKVGAADYLYLKSIILGKADRPQIQYTDSTDTLTDGELKKYINMALAANRMQGELIVFFAEGADLQTARETFTSLGLPDTLDDKSVYLYCSAADEPLQFKKLWFTICVPESKIRDIMFALHRNEAISLVHPNYLGSWA